MADSIKLASVADDTGFKLRVAHFLQKKAASILVAGSPAPAELVLAKAVAFSGAPEGDQESQIVARFARMIVTVAAVANALATTTPPYAHTQFSEADFETQVNNLWPTYAKAVI